MVSPRYLVAAYIAATAVSAHAQCSGNRLNLDTDILTLVQGKMLCGRAVKPGYPGDAADRWQEEHVAGGVLIDFKLGPGHAVDPRKPVGSWTTAVASRTDPATITHVYGPTVAFTWVVYGPAINSPGTSVYSFCTAGASPVEHVRAYVLPISGTGCSGSYPP